MSGYETTRGSLNRQNGPGYFGRDELDPRRLRHACYPMADGAAVWARFLSATVHEGFAAFETWRRTYGAALRGARGAAYSVVRGRACRA